MSERRLDIDNQNNCLTVQTPPVPPFLRYIGTAGDSTSPLGAPGNRELRLTTRPQSQRGVPDSNPPKNQQTADAAAPHQRSSPSSHLCSSVSSPSLKSCPTSEATRATASPRLRPSCGSAGLPSSATRVFKQSNSLSRLRTEKRTTNGADSQPVLLLRWRMSVRTHTGSIQSRTRPCFNAD